MTAFLTQKFGLRRPIIRMDITANATPLTGVGRRYGNKPGAVPSRLVFQHLADLRWRHVQQRAVQSGFLPDVPAGLFERSRRAARHVAYFQILDSDEAVVLGYLRCRLMGSVLAPPHQFCLESGDGHLSLPPVPGTFRPPRQPLLQGRQFPAFPVANTRQHDYLTRRQDDRFGNAQVNSYRRPKIGQRLLCLNLALDRDIPAIRLTADRGRLRLSFQWTMLHPLNQPGFGQENPSRRNLELTWQIAPSPRALLRAGPFLRVRL